MVNFYRGKFSILKKKKLSRFIEIHKNTILNYNIINDFELNDVSSLDDIKNCSLIFINKKRKKNTESLINIDKLFCVITDDFDFFELNNDEMNIILIESIDYLYREFLDSIYITDDNTLFSDEYELINGSYISLNASVDKSSKIYPGCFIGMGCTIGKNCIIKQNCSIKNAIIGKNTIIQENTSIGSSGFGFPVNKGSNFFFPHIGIVIIGENCSIGSNCTIDRGRIDFTLIDDNCMLDNLIHIAHNVRIGKNSTIAAQSGISGSVTIGENFKSGGQVGVAGHIKIESNVVVAAKSGITKNIKGNSVVAGFPATDINEWKKEIIINRKKNK